MQPSMGSQRVGHDGATELKKGSSDRFYFLGLPNHWMATAAMKLKDDCSLEGKL